MDKSKRKNGNEDRNSCQLTWGLMVYELWYNKL